MIIELSRGFEDLINLDAWRPYMDAVQNLIEGHRAGWHIFLPTKATLEILLEHPDLSTRQRSTLDAGVRQKYATLSGVAKDSFFSVLTIPNDQAYVADRPNQSKILRLTSFSDLESCRRSELLVENADTDGAFFILLCNAFQNSFGVSNRVNIVPRMGGGASIAQEYRRAARAVSPTLCIVDSDKNAPSDSLGSTATNIRNIRGTEMYPTVEVEILNVREIENFVPLETARDMYSGNQAIQDEIDLIKRLEYNDRHSNKDIVNLYIRYYDFKNGLKRSIIRQASAETRIFLLDMWKVMRPNDGDLDYTDTDLPDNITRGISENMMRIFIEYLDMPTNIREFSSKAKRSILWPELELLLGKIVAFGVAPERIRT